MGYPPPSLKAWSTSHVQRLLTNPAYGGVSRWGASAWGTYFEAKGENVISCGKVKVKGRQRKKPVEDAISIAGVNDGIVAPDLFKRACRKATPLGRRQRYTANNRYPLSGLLFCTHCGRRMVAASSQVRNHKGQLLFTLQKYLCSLYAEYGRNELNNTTCGHHTIRAERVSGWLAYKLKEVYLGSGRDVLIEKIKAKLCGAASPNRAKWNGWRSTTEEFDRQVNRLVGAIQTTEAAELVERLATVKEGATHSGRN